MFEALLNSMIASYGQLGLFIVMVMQTIIAPIPSEALLIFAGAIGIPMPDIIIFGSSGLIVGSVIAFFVARWGGKPLVEKFLGPTWTDRINGWISRNGGKAILFTRLVPFIPFDLISYISGVTSLKFRDYFIATVIGAFPRTIILAIMGGGAKDILDILGVSIELTMIIGIAGLIVIIYLGRKGSLKKIEKIIIGWVTRKFRSKSY